MSGQAEDGGATLALKPKVLRDQRAVRQCEHAVVAVGRQLSLNHDREIVWIKPMDVRAVDGDNRAVGVGNDCPAPHVIAARQLWRGDNRFETDRIDALHPPDGGR